MKVIPTAAGRRINTYSPQQSPFQIKPKQQFDSVTFGNTGKIVFDGDLNFLEYLHRISIGIKGNATLGDVLSDSDFTVGGDLTANFIGAKTACIKGTSTITDKIDVEDLVAMGKFTTKHMESQKAHFLHGATFNGYADAETLTVAGGDLTVKGNTNVQRIISNGGNVELSHRVQLDSIALINPNPNVIPKAKKIPTRVLNLNAVREMPNTLIVVLDKFQRLVVQAPEEILSKLEFHNFDDCAKDFVGDVLPQKAIERLIKLVKTAA